MIESQRFRKATDFLKFNKKIKFKSLADELGVEHYLIDNIRRDQTQPTDALIEKLLLIYPEVKRFFITKYEKSLNEEGQDNYLSKEDDPPTYEVKSAKNIYVNLIDALQVAVDAQKVTIRTLEAKLEELKEQNMKLKNER